MMGVALLWSLCLAVELYNEALAMRWACAILQRTLKWLLHPP